MAAAGSDILPFTPRCSTKSSSENPKFVIHRNRSASSSSSVTIAPPSNVLTSLVAWKLKTAASPKLPIGRPRAVAPKAWAASKSNGNPLRSARAASASTSQAFPQR